MFIKNNRFDYAYRLFYISLSHHGGSSKKPVTSHDEFRQVSDRQFLPPQ